MSISLDAFSVIITYCCPNELRNILWTNTMFSRHVLHSAQKIHAYIFIYCGNIIIEKFYAQGTLHGSYRNSQISLITKLRMMHFSGGYVIEDNIYGIIAYIKNSGHHNIHIVCNFIHKVEFNQVKWDISKMYVADEIAIEQNCSDILVYSLTDAKKLAQSISNINFVECKKYNPRRGSGFWHINNKRSYVIIEQDDEICYEPITQRRDVIIQDELY